MNEALRLDQKQGLAQTLAPLQVQYVKLLEMGTAAFEDEVSRRVDENPALESADADERAAQEAGNTAVDEPADFDSEDDAADRFATPGGSQPGRAMPMEANADAAESLTASLERQLGELSLPPADMLMARYIIGNLDDNGWLTRPLDAVADDIAMHTGADITAADLAGAFAAVRSLEPAGVGATDLRDCLLLQLNRLPSTPAAVCAREIVGKYFDIFAAKNRARLKRLLDVDDAGLDAAIQLIMRMNPKPAGSGPSAVDDRRLHITPDFEVYPDEDHPGRFFISLTQRLPELTVAESFSPEAEKALDSHASDRETAAARAFIRSRRTEARDFIGLVQRRNDTLMAVMRAIVAVQSAFFQTEDPATLRPMILKDIAAMTGRDMSVVSRAAGGKYVATPGGVYPLKMFFSERPREDSDISAPQILAAMRALIESEDKRRPLSDDALQQALAAQGLDIARRTVAKYREQLNIPNSRHRRSITETSK